MTLSTTFVRPLAATCILLLVLLTGCDSTDSNSTEEISPDETAEMIAVTLAEGNGGTADDLASAERYAQSLESGANASSADGAKAYMRSCQYDNTDQVWACSVTATRTTSRYDAAFDRTVEIQFLNADGQPQPAYEVNGVPAASLSYSVLSGSGTFEGPRMTSQHTLPAPGQSATFWTVDNPEGDVLTINGSGSRTVSNGQEGLRGTRTRNATITTQAANVVVERGVGLRSGTISGTYEAEVELTNNSGDSATRSINVEYIATFTSDTVEITFTGGGERFDGRTFSFASDTGEPV